ncbi:MAG: GSU2403 family nucleotidyltransferase fold protein [Myxococcota bacterium]
MEPAYNMPRLEPASLAVYSELLDQLRSQTPGLPRGTLVTKKVKGHTYWYVQYAEVGQRRQVYLGPDDRDTRDRLERLRAAWDEDQAFARHRAKLVAMLQAAGVPSPSNVAARVLEVLSRHGVFHSGGVLVGSQAFLAYAPMLGVRWLRGYRTEDVDVASERRVRLAFPRKANLPLALRETGLTFDGVPGLDPQEPSTSFTLRGKPLRVDVLTPEVGPPAGGPVRLPHLGVAAAPLRLLDYLIEEPVPAAIAARKGILVQVPQPGRFAWHKLLIAGRRGVHEQAKAHKDMDQAAQLIPVLLDDRPGDLVLAWEALAPRGPAWRKGARAGLARLPAELRAAVKETCGLD